jgi:CDP-diacylglycerol--glycerol-3-phosphate 3-phosphatidyltransferase
LNSDSPPIAAAGSTVTLAAVGTDTLNAVLSLYALKHRFQGFLRPFVRRLAAAGVTANQVTLVSCALSVGLGTWLAWENQNRSLLLLLPPFFVLRMAFNAMDGILAREFGQQSNLGTYLNELTDVVSDAFLYLPFAYLPGFNPLWIGAAILLAAVSELAGVLAVLIGASRRYDGPMGKSDRALAFGAAAAWLGSGGTFAPWVASVFEKAVVVLLLFTIVNRVRNGLAEIGTPRANSGLGSKL